jgi:hypothetical protein
MIKRIKRNTPNPIPRAFIITFPSDIEYASVRPPSFEERKGDDEEPATLFKRSIRLLGVQHGTSI